jgi:formylglycine-generating enzyme required for sulfatase activity
MTSGKRTLGILLCTAVLSACGARSSLLDVDTWLEDTRRERESNVSTGTGTGTGGQGGGSLDPGHDEVCGKGLKGPTMVVIPVPDKSSFCIDSTEVTSKQYRAFLQAAVPFSNQPSFCSWNDSYDSYWKPPYTTLPYDAPPDDFPTNSLDWCDARAYCAWAGKRLCGKIGGGHIVDEDPTSQVELHPLDEEWMYACSAGGTRTYPYGNVYDATACVTQGYDGNPNFNYITDDLHPIREATRCVGGFPGLYDMGGNATEWIDESGAETGKDDFVISLGGYYGSDELEARCGFRLDGTRDVAYGATGIRCCKEGPL